MMEETTEIPYDQLRAIAAMSGADAAELDEMEPETVVEWLDRDPEFVARLNRAKSFQAERLRADVRSLAADAMATLRELVTNPDVPPSVRLRASLAVLQASDATTAQPIGPTSPRGVKSIQNRRAL